MRTTSRDAAKSIEDVAGKLRRAVFKVIWESKGMTCDEVEVALGMRHQTASARVCELHQKGHIIDSGKRRPTRSGRDAIVWAPVRRRGR
jgi:predicted transcriptional regulator